MNVLLNYDVMELTRLKDVRLPDHRKYSGWGYYESEYFIPQGCGKKYYSDFYAYGNYKNGELNGPAVISYDYYMYTMQCSNNRGNGWGLCINRGELVEFGYYVDSKLRNDLTDFAYWYFTKMKQSQRNENMLHVYTFNDTHQVSKILIALIPQHYYKLNFLST